VPWPILTACLRYYLYLLSGHLLLIAIKAVSTNESIYKENRKEKKEKKNTAPTA
jgi:hypothetical protein